MCVCVCVCVYVWGVDGLRERERIQYYKYTDIPYEGHSFDYFLVVACSDSYSRTGKKKKIFFIIVKIIIIQ